MKKILLGTTALVAAAGFAGFASAQAVKSGAPSLSISGELEFEAAYFDNDGVTNDRSFDFWQGGDLVFSPSWTHDNGLTVVGRIDLVTAANEFVSDETSITFKGATFGTIVLGDDDGPVDSLRVNGPLPGDGLWDGTAGAFASNDPGIALDGGNSGDATKLHYTTAGLPLGGFVMGVALTPNGNTSSTIPSSSNFFSSGKVGTRQEGALDNMIELGAQWSGDVSGIGVLIGGGYTSASNNSVGASASPQGFTGGLNLSYAGFTLGGGYSEQDDFGTDYETANIGLSYTMGDWTVGGNFGTIARTSTDDGSAYGLGANYSIAPGLAVNGDLMFYENNFTNADSTVLMLGTVVKF